MSDIFSDSNQDCKITGRMSDDRLKLFLDIERLHPRAIFHRESILRLLSHHIDLPRVHVGVIDDIVRLLNEGETRIENRRIMSGEPARPGTDGKLLILVKKFRG